MSLDPGFLLADKAGGWTSHDVVAKARRITGIRKIGHAGTLDPMATGLLVLGVGSATRLLRYVTDLPKEYEAVARFGVATDSLDADGEITGQEPMDFDQEALEQTMRGFLGDIRQTPPMVSAVKVGGKRLHELARKGEEVERPARAVLVNRLELEEFMPGEYPLVRFRVVAGKGFYVRVLADDLAKQLGGRAHLTCLRRVASGHLRVEDALTIEQMSQIGGENRPAGAMIPPGHALSHLPALEVDATTAGWIRNGRKLERPSGWEIGRGSVRIMAEGQMLAVYRAGEDVLLPEVVLS
ncbi:MAG: tRNA pseudouridine(55) synthase TruB [Acidimicrobiia bacterium]|nr:tRNA pseudouridine(55) synthase TruB [Acidimicrobiia bacterium]MYF25927.1 tRNA pseudouridine(55) synthase TruB [Acidimicrobiia bacterium]